MKINFNYHSSQAEKSSKGAGYYPQHLSLTEATIWFLLTAVVLFFLSAVNP